MLDASVAENSGDPFAWENAFLVLAVRRCLVFWADMGVPSAMAQLQQPLNDVARALVDAHHNLESPTIDDYVSAHVALRADAFRSIHRAYGEAVTRELQRWAARYFVDRERANAWWYSGVLLRQVANMGHHSQEPTASGISVETLARIQPIIDHWFNEDLMLRNHDRLTQAEAAPLETIERRWITMTDDDTDDESRDLLIVKMTIENESCYGAWNELTTMLSARERRVFPRWVRDIGLNYAGIPSELLPLPDMERTS